MMRNNGAAKAVATQLRLPDELHRYVRLEATRLGISQNSFILVLMEDGRRFREAQISLLARDHHRQTGN